MKPGSKLQKYLDYVKAHPGTTAMDMAKALNMNAITASSSLHTLSTSKLVVRMKNTSHTGRGASYTYRAVGSAPEKAKKPSNPVFPAGFSLPAGLDDRAPSPVVVIRPTAPPEATPVPPEVERQIDEASGITRRVGASPTLGAAYGEHTGSLDRLIDVFVDALAGAVASRLRPMIESKLSGAVASMSEEIVRVTQKEAKIKLRRVLICGCRDKDGQMLRHEYAGMLDIDWVTVECASDVWKGKARNAHAVIVMTEFVGHKHTEMIKETGVVPELHRGGYAKLRDRLIELSVN